ncbi:ankyrin [Hypoxylon sp. NC1633]|nr:ankyrin [Hypoxylon sp. NC1633]
MADPLSIAASIAGLITLVDMVFSGLKKYSNSAKNAPKEIEDLAKEINRLGGALNSLSRLARSFDNEAIDNSKFRMHHIESCSEILLDLDKKLKKLEGTSFKKRLVWPFSSDRIKEMLEDLARHQTSIDLALSANSLDFLLRSLALQEDNQKTTSEILAKIEETRELTGRIHRDGDRDKVLSFFLKYNPQQNHIMSLKLRHPRTGLWLQRLPTFQTWLSKPNEKLWFTGIPGAGKTVLAGAIIKEARGRCNEFVAEAFFYCDYKDEKTHSPENILGALAYKLAIQKEEAYALLEQYFGDLHPLTGLPCDPTIDELKRVIKRMTKLYDRVFLIVDGIDECGKFVDVVLEALCSISKDSDNISMALLSRDEPNIRDYLEEDFECESVAAHTEDITEYVTAEIEERIRTGRLRIDDLDIKDEIMQGLIDGAAGMFRWVSCQLDHLGDCGSDQECREALKRLPPDLNETYIRILRRVPLNKMRPVQLVLHFIAFADPQLDITQLREAVSVPENGYLESSALVRESSIQKWCSSLIRKSNDGDCFEFAHFSVLEFLQNESLLSGQFEQFLISKSRCNRLMATQCLRYIQLENFNRMPVATTAEIDYIIDRDSKYTLYKYAALHWPRYARDEWADKEIVESAKRLFAYNKTSVFTAWSIDMILWCIRGKKIENPEFGAARFQKHAYDFGFISQLIHRHFTTLHMACLLSLPVIASYLLKLKADIRRKNPIGTPMQCAVGTLCMIKDKIRSDCPNFEICESSALRPEDTTETIRCLFRAEQERHQASGGFRHDEGLFGLALGPTRGTFDLSILTLLLTEGVTFYEQDIELCLDLFSPKFWRSASLRTSQTLGSSLELFIKTVNSMIDSSPAHRKLCSAAWAVAVEQRLSFASDPFFVDPSISLTQEAQKEMMIAAVEEGNEEAFSKIQRASSLNPSGILDIGGKSLLHQMLEHCSDHDVPLAMVERLVEVGCSLFETDDEGHLPVHAWRPIPYEPSQQSKHNTESLVAYFIDHGVVVTSQDSNGKNLLHLSIADHTRLSAYIEYENEANVASALHTTDNGGYTPLCRALKEGHRESASLLFARGGIDPATWQSPTSVLLLATKASCEDVFRGLWNSGISLTITDDGALTPPHCLGAMASIDFVTYLKSLYPDTCDVRINGKIPLDSYLEELVNNFDECPDPENTKDIIRALYPSESEIDNRKLVWEHFVNNVIPDARSRWPRPYFWSYYEDKDGLNLVKLCTGILAELTRLGRLESYDMDSQRPALLLPLQDVEYNKDVRYRNSYTYTKEDSSYLWPFSDQTVYNIINGMSHWQGFPIARPFISLLKTAVAFKDSDLLKLLLDKGVSVHQRIQGKSALEEACRSNVGLDMFRLLLNHSDKQRLDETNPENGGLGLIHCLAVPDATHKIAELLQRGANPNLRTRDRLCDPALTYHLLLGSITTSLFLLEHDADLKLLSSTNIDACLMATWKGCTEFLTKVHERTPQLQLDWERRCDLSFTSKFIGTSAIVLNGVNALHLASLSGNIDCLKFYINHNIIPDVNTTSQHLFTPLHCAAIQGDANIIGFLHGLGANVNARTDSGQSPLHLAVLYKKMGAVEKLLELGSGIAADNEGMTPYMYACQSNNQAFIDMFESRGHCNYGQNNTTSQSDTAASTMRQQRQARALENAIRHGNLKLCQELFLEGCQLDIDLPSCNGCSPLLLAIRIEKADLVDWLLVSKAVTLKQSCQSCGGRMAIQELLMRKKLVRVLPRFLNNYLSDGGCLFKEYWNQVGKTVANENFDGLRLLLEHVQQNARHYTDMVGEPEAKAVSLAVNRGCGLQARASPLHISASRGNLEITDYLLEKGADVNALDKDENTPLHVAILSKSSKTDEIVRKLISNGAELDFRDDNGATPLMLAAKDGLWNVVKILLDAGADPFSLNYYGDNALHLASYYEEPRIFAELVATGLNPHLHGEGGVSAIHSAMCDYQLSNLILDGNYDIRKTGPFPWKVIPITPVYLTTKYPMFRRRIPFDDLQRITNLQPNDAWSPLCLSASKGEVLMMRNLLALQADLEFEGCPDGTALMTACRAGRLESVIILVRRGAALSYDGPNGFRTAFDKVRTPQHILRWLLVTRFTDQARIKNTSDDNSSTEPTVLRPWSGITKASLVICGDLERNPDQSSKDYWIFLMGKKKEWRGKVVPTIDRRRTIRPSKLIPTERVRIHPGGYEVPRVTG